jgi:CHASE2 domain-containing sensor protein/two-component sensor histidine kinase
MVRQFHQKIYQQRQNKIWHIALPGLIAITFIVLLRLFGTLQFLELTAFDALMRSRPQEPRDDKILIVGINEEDIKTYNYPIPDRQLALLLQTLKSYQPAVVGLDIFRDLPQEPGHQEFVEVLKTTKNLIAVDKILGDKSDQTVNPPPALPISQVGFSDSILDIDGKQRRNILLTSNSQGEARLGFTLKVAESYLKTQKIELNNVPENPNGFLFANTKILPLTPNFGSYIKTNANGSQILINFRSAQKPFLIVSLSDILLGRISASKIKGKIILIGMTSPSAKDYANTAAINSENPALNYGVEMQAHMVSQIVSAVLEQRPLIQSWQEIWEYLWIVFWGILGIILGRKFSSSIFILISVISSLILLIIISYILLIFGWWVPVVSACLILGFNGLILTAFSRYHETLKLQIRDREVAIEKMFDAIHSHPLQTLSQILREVQSDISLTPQQFTSKLMQLNDELRGVREIARKALLESNNFYLRAGQKIDLQHPLHELLYEVYLNVLEREHLYLQGNKLTKIVKFESMNEQHLSEQHKENLCRFLEEALCNVGKHARGTTQIQVICVQEQGENKILVADNGSGIDTMSNLSSNSGFGTKQAQNLAKQLRGKFQRFPNSPKGLVCQLTWAAKKSWFH